MGRKAQTSQLPEWCLKAPPGPLIHTLLPHLSARPSLGTRVPQHPHPLVFWSPNIPMSWYPIPRHHVAPSLPIFRHPAPPAFPSPGTRVLWYSGSPNKVKQKQWERRSVYVPGGGKAVARGPAVTTGGSAGGAAAAGRGAALGAARQGALGTRDGARRAGRGAAARWGRGSRCGARRRAERGGEA